MTGSPTLLVNGVDPFATSDHCDCGLSCRLYRNEHDQFVATPSLTQLRTALTRAPAS